MNFPALLLATLSIGPFAGQCAVATLEGMFICPEGAATVAALNRLLADGVLQPDEKVLILNTGSGLKYLELLQD